MSKPYRIIGMVAVKNEATNMERWLLRNAEFLDGIVALDDGSTDGTTELLRDHPKVISFTRRPPGTPWYLVKNLQYILGEAKKTGAEWLFHLDSDDVMEQRFSGMLDDLLKNDEVGRYRFREVTLWRSTRNYRIDRPEEYFRITPYPTLMRNNEALEWVVTDEGWNTCKKNFKRWVVSWLSGKPNGYKPLRKRRYKGVRANKILKGVRGPVVDLGDIVRIHYHYANWDLAWKKQIRYALNYSIALNYRPEEIDALYEYFVSRLDEDGLQLAPVRPEWGVLD